MLEGVAEIFDKKEEMMKKLKKASYKKNMEVFRGKYGHYFDEMTSYVSLAEDKDAAAKEVAQIFVADVKTKFEKPALITKKMKINSRTQADLNFFMIFYGFPAILLTEDENATKIADAICDTWGKTFKDSKISYTTYEKLVPQFKEKILGII